MVEHGRFESPTPYITVKPEHSERGRSVINEEYAAKWGTSDIRIPVKSENMMEVHIKNFLDCVKSRNKPNLDVETGAKAQVAISMAVQAYREGRVLYFDEAKWRVVPRPPRA